MRLIDADSLINVIENSYLTAGEKRLFKIKVNKAPTVEITEEEIQNQLNARCMSVVANEYLIALHNNRITAEWIIEKNTRDIICSNCGKSRRDTRTQHIYYCNHCGARMINASEVIT